jgi:hypothetical protein
LTVEKRFVLTSFPSYYSSNDADWLLAKGKKQRRENPQQLLGRAFIIITCCGAVAVKNEQLSIDKLLHINEL